MSVQWNRPTENRSGQMVYLSKDGRFTITRRKYVLPFSSTGYVLSGAGVPRWARESDRLSDAKLRADVIVDSEDQTRETTP